MANERRLIDANAIKYEKRTECFGHGAFFEVQKVYKEDIDKIPTVDAVEVVHGRWEIDKSFMPFISTCSECGAIYDIDGAFDWYYCPNCGAKMDGDGNG